MILDASYNDAPVLYSEIPSNIKQVRIMKRHSNFSLYKLSNFLLALVTLNLAACGGGGTSSTSSSIPDQNPPLNLTAAVTTLAGTGTSGSVDSNTGTDASFYLPESLTSDGINLYVADTGNNKIRKIVIATNAVTTFAGSGTQGSSDATGIAATFNFPTGITNDGTNLYVTDSINHKIRKIVISSGLVTTIAGTGFKGSTDATGTAASFDFPNGIATDGTNLYVVDTGNHLIRKVVIASGVVTTLAGSGSIGSSDGTGVTASFNYPNGIVVIGANLYVTDMGNNIVRRIVMATGVVSTIAGSGVAGSNDAT